ncbi:phospholipase D family protein [Polynucleobacter victoriensis]|uniref:phospholipase D n=1 Tax=Polynucleobacter victoriensis TaxID=2049319 RepID=A0A212T2P6_9BURK|nr:phospholipase D family protein [Polynucleobacter victoriensis]SNC60312.1 PLD-like domain-containing protein [Polynucleobacter victoriensis]
MTTNTYRITAKTRQRMAVFLCLSVLAAVSWWQSVNAQAEPAEILGIYFTPPIGGASGIIKQIDASKKSIKVMAYGFTSINLAEALVRAKKRGVDVALIQDEKSSQNNREALQKLLDVGIEVRSDGKHAIQHNKVMVIDQDVVITGSYNFTNSAETRNAENIMIVKSEYAARRYLDNWNNHWEHAIKVVELPPSRQRR